ncbi:MAG: beta galactosidase jelly roll domain-containing protein, partial [Planctomycetota bacterium]|nr:beta galactosidase jelly roll domain-containing protein [Planctomycetota bacterium]
TEQQLDAAYATADAVYIGVEGLDAAGEPIPDAAFRHFVRIGADGEAVTKVNGAAAKPGKAPSLGGWERAGQAERVAGTSERYATIEGPSDLVSLGAPEGYGWMRLRIKANAAKKTNAAFFQAADRLHLYLDSKFIGIVGAGPGAEGPMHGLPLKKGVNELTVLVDNLGRSTAGGPMGDRKGLFGHVYEVKPVPKVKREVVEGAPLMPLSFRSPLWGVHAYEPTRPERLTWQVTHRRKSPLILALDGMDGAVSAHALVLLNDEPVDWLEPGGPRRFIFTSEALKQGKNVIQLALLEDDDAVRKAIGAAAKLYEGVNGLTEGAEWAFAKWERPEKGRFESVSKSAMGGSKLNEPTWWRCTFKVKDAAAPLHFDASGLTKGQIFVNGRNLGRYWVTTPSNKKVPPQTQSYIPEAWLNLEGENEIVIFDEHGATPNRCKLVYDAMGPMGD